MPSSQQQSFDRPTGMIQQSIDHSLGLKDCLTNFIDVCDQGALRRNTSMRMRTPSGPSPMPSSRRQSFNSSPSPTTPAQGLAPQWAENPRKSTPSAFAQAAGAAGSGDGETCGDGAGGHGSLHPIFGWQANYLLKCSLSNILFQMFSSNAAVQILVLVVAYKCQGLLPNDDDVAALPHMDLFPSFLFLKTCVTCAVIS